LLTSIVVRPIIGFAARRKASRAAARMRGAVENVAADLALAGVQHVARAYTEARAAWGRRRGPLEHSLSWPPNALVTGATTAWAPTVRITNMPSTMPVQA
jgi:hypothetical protein